jgi:hypothetical protein
VNVPEQAPTATPEVQPSATPASESEAATNVDATEVARRQREARAKERAKLQEQTAAKGAANSPASPPAATNTVADVAKPQPTSANASRKATVQVTYDENGRVTQASGGDATALRIARQKRFPPGKGGSATITIPIN